MVKKLLSLLTSSIEIVDLVMHAFLTQDLRTHIPSIPWRTNSDVESLSIASTESAGDYTQIRNSQSAHNSYS